MIGNLIVNFFQGAQYTRGAAAALLIAALIVVLLVVFRRSLEVEDPIRHVTSTSSRPAAGLSAARLSAWAVLIYVFLFAPIVLLVVFSFNANQYGTFPITGWTTKWYRDRCFSDYQIRTRLRPRSHRAAR